MKFCQTILATVMTALLMVLPQSAQAAATQTAQGIWADQDGKSNIEIGACGNALCGRIVWLAEPLDQGGQPKTDVNNPEPARRSQPIMGMTIIKGLKPYEGDAQLKGVVYNAEDGKVYDIYLEPNGATMAVEGCFAMFLCGSQTWTRVK